MELGLALEVECQGLPEDFVVVTDASRIEQVVINLLSNALKLTTAGRIRIVAAATSTTAGLVTIRVEMHDQGPGVPQDQGERIFQSFEQLPAGRAVGGAGLGLAICSASIDSLNGRIGVDASPDGGALFWFEILSQRVSRVDGFQAKDVSPMRGLSVLAAEDHAANRKLLRLLLEQFGATVTLVDDGAQAVEIARTRTFDLVLMDVMMPVMDGVEAVQAIRGEKARTGRPRLPVHMLTANVFDEDVARYLAAGADGVLRKPIEISALQGVLAAVASAAHQTRGLAPHPPLRSARGYVSREDALD